MIGVSPSKIRYIQLLSILAIGVVASNLARPLSYTLYFWTDSFFALYALLMGVHTYKNRLPVGYKLQARIWKNYLIPILILAFITWTGINLFFLIFRENSSFHDSTNLWVGLIAVVNLSVGLFNFNEQRLHPALLFVLSFVMLIIAGTILLMIPGATTRQISLVDALFTSTSSVCVTGLSVLDTGQDFTHTGQIIILILFQLGALGMLTFTNLLGLLFRGAASYRNRLFLKDMINAKTMSSTFNTLRGIIIFTLTTELIGAACIYLTLDPEMGKIGERLFFSIFHGVSAFCNAGFSTLSASLYESGYRHQYDLHLIIAILIILGGIGYSVCIGYYRYLFDQISYQFFRLIKRKTKRSPFPKPVMNVNTKIVIYTTFILLSVGMVTFLYIEWNNSIATYSIWGKLVASLFASVTTRTAGFNTVDTGSLNVGILVVMLVLMWIGASPGSTGGGIKTTTFGVAMMNIYQQVTGKPHIVLAWRKVPQRALQRSTSIITLSLISISLAVWVIMQTDKQLSFLPVLFECVSAYSTVGLSMCITGKLSTAGKLMLIVTMFIGRVGLLTFLTGLVRHFSTYTYDPLGYPEEEIFIN